MTPAVGYTEMRDSGIEWVGKIPKEWKVTRMKTILQNVSEKNHPDATVLSLYRDLGVVPKNSRDDNHNVTSEDTSNYKFVRCGDLVINKMKAWQGSLAVSEFEGIVSPAYYVCKFISNSTDKKYLHYLLRCRPYAQEFERLSTGMRVGQWDLGIDDFLRIPVICPSISEQTAIAAYLDIQCAKIDEIIAEAKASIEDYKQWKASIIYEAVTKGLDPKAELKDSGIEWIGEIPKEWLVTKMRKVASFYNGDRTSRYPKPDDFVVAGVPFINSTNLNGDTLNMTSCKYITEEKYNSLSGTKLRPNDIVYCLRGSVGKCAINTTLQRGTVASSLMSIRAERINPYFLLFVLLSDVISRQTGVYINGTCAANLSAENVGGFAVPFPPAQEQGQIAECLMRKGAMIDELIADKSELIANLDTYKKSLIYEVVTGKRRVC